MRKLKFGLLCEIQALSTERLDEKFSELIEQVRLAKSLGFDSIFSGHHFLASPYQTLQNIPVLGRLAADADGMTLGTGVLLLPLLNPVDVAEQISTLDVITGGRFVFGVGLGYRETEYRAFGVEPSERVARFREALDVIRELWTKKKVNFKGRYIHLEDVAPSTYPVQKPHPPIWIAANSDKAVARAASIGDAWFANPHVSLATLALQMKIYSQSLASQGKPIPREIPIMRELYIAEDKTAAYKMARPFLEEKYAVYRAWGQDSVVPSAETFDKPFDDLARERFIIGSPEDCVEQIGKVAALGFNHFIFRIQWPGMSQQAAMRAIRLIGEYVAPSF